MVYQSEKNGIGTLTICLRSKVSGDIQFSINGWSMKWKEGLNNVSYSNKGSRSSDKDEG